MKSRLLWALIVVATVAIAASLLGSWGVVSLPGLMPVILRWVAIALLAGYAGTRRSLTAWILVGLAAGAELGHDWPSAAEKGQFLGAIFLRLIKGIIAPLFFGTLVL